MARLQPHESFATGMVRPKTTALFFDKLWVHPALIRGFAPDRLEPYRVPPELCVPDPMGAGAYYDSFERQCIYLASAWSEETETDPEEALRRLTLETWDRRAIFEVEALQHFEDTRTPLWDRLRRLVPPSPAADVGGEAWKIYVSTQRRNEAISFIVRLYAGRGVELTPVYLDPIEYDGVTRSQTLGLEVCLASVPTVLDAELTWEQVAQLRADRDAVARLNRLRRWFTTDLLGKDEREVRAILEQRLDDYRYALRKHGIQTALAGATSVLSFAAGPTALSAITASPLAVAAGGLALASGALAWIGTKLIERADLERSEVAYLYDVRKLTA